MSDLVSNTDAVEERSGGAAPSHKRFPRAHRSSRVPRWRVRGVEAQRPGARAGGAGGQLTGPVLRLKALGVVARPNMDRHQHHQLRTVSKRPSWVEGACRRCRTAAAISGQCQCLGGEKRRALGGLPAGMKHHRKALTGRLAVCAGDSRRVLDLRVT